MDLFEVVSHKKRNRNESEKYVNRCKLDKYVIPFNVKINIIDSIEMYETPKYYNELSKKIQKIINLIDMYYIDHVKNNVLYRDFKSVHIANLTYKNQQTIRTNDYRRTYQDNEHITSFHAEHSVISSCCKFNLYLDRCNTILCVIRYDRNGKRCNSKPCGHCTYQIKKNNIRNIIYSMDDDLFYCCKIR